MSNIFNQSFWLDQWDNDKKNDTFNVHRGFSTPEYWDKASTTYDENQTEVKNRKLDKTIDFFERAGLLKTGMKILEIGCGTGMLAIELAKQGADVTALDFSQGMLDKFKKSIPARYEDQIQVLKEDWHKIDVKKRKWEKYFDLVISFMSPGVATPDNFFKMISCSKKGCAVRGWAAKKPHPILAALWEKINGIPLEDKPQSILYKINLLFSMGYFPEITFDTVKWGQDSSVEEELDRQVTFFKKVSKKPLDELEKTIVSYLRKISVDNKISRRHEGLTATAVWDLTKQY